MASHESHPETRSKNDVLEAQAHGAEFVDLKADAVNEERQAESELTLKQFLVRYPAIVWWSFYWAMAAVGWYVAFPSSLFSYIVKLTLVDY